MDLLREIRQYRMPILEEDLGAILVRLAERGMVARSDLEAVARRRGKMSDMGEFADAAFG